MKLQSYTLQYLSIALLVVIGVWAAVFYVNMLDEIYDSIDDGLDNSRLLIINKMHTDSSIIHKSEFMESNYAIREVSPDDALPQRDVYYDTTFYMENEKDFEPVRILRTAFLADNGRYYELKVASSMVEEDDLISDLLFALVWLYLILLASVLLINNVLLKKIWKPFNDTLARLRSFHLGKHENFSVTPTKVEEFNELNETVTTLLERTVHAYHSQKQFIENAAHELQTPLAISVNKLELFAEKNTLSDSQMTELSSVIESLERLTRLNKTLLLLSRIENRQFPESESVNFNDLVHRLTSVFKDISEFKQVSVDIQERGTCVSSMNNELAGIMISNLLKNAISHNHPSGIVQIIVTDQEISIANTGEVQPLDPEKIFGRFYKQSSSSASTGLGLAIVKSIADYYNIQVRYSFDGRHVFTLRFIS